MADFEDKNQEGPKTEEQENPLQEQEPVFVRERVLNRSENRRRWISRAALLVGSALVFGVVSCLTFVLLRPYAEQWFKKDAPESQISVPRDEETEESTEGTAAAETEEDLEDVVESAVESYRWTVSDYESLYRAVHEVAEQAESGIVTVTTRTQTADWFNNPIETEGQVSGVVWSITSYEMLILTSYQAQENETTVEVTFSNGVSAAASVKAADGKTGMAIVSVPLAGVDDITKSKVTPVALGSSVAAEEGQPVVLVGSPKDYVGSIAYGMITYIRSSVKRQDMEVQMLYTDVSTTDKATGFVMNLDGEIIGMITSGNTGTNTSAIGISDLKSSIERLSNGSFLAYLGIVGQDVTEQISEENQIPEGIYISEVAAESPAYNSGLQNGDIIYAIDETEIASVADLQEFLEGKVAGEDVTVRARRMGRDGYTEIEFPVVLGTR